VKRFRTANHQAWRRSGATLLAALIPALLLTQPGAGELLQYSREAVGGGQWWRVLTSHWVHWNGEHALWDSLAFAALLFAGLRLSAKRTALALLAGSVLIPAAVWFLLPGMAYYRGLSGLASVLYVFVVLELLATAWRHDRWVPASILGVVLIGFAAKTVFEFVTGTTVFVQSMGPGVIGVPLAHLVGGALGACVVGCGEKGEKLKTEMLKWDGMTS